MTEKQFETANILKNQMEAITSAQIKTGLDGTAMKQIIFVNELNEEVKLSFNEKDNTTDTFKTPEFIEFANQILVNIQKKLDDEYLRLFEQFKEL